MGAVSDFGTGVDTLWRGVIGGGTALSNAMRSTARVDRAFESAMAVAGEAIADAGWSTEERASAGLVVSTTKAGLAVAERALASPGPPSPEVPARAPLFMLAARLAGALGIGGAVQTVSVACASGTTALGVAQRWLRAGRAARVLVVGADAVSEFVVRGFEALRALASGPARPFDTRRDGLRLGEGAAALALEAGAGAARARLLGFGGANDANHITGPARDGRGLRAAVARALADARLSIAALDGLCAHGTGTPFNDRMEAVAWSILARPELPAFGIKGAVGHTLGAAGLLEAVVSVRALETGWWPPTAGFERADPEAALRVHSGEPIRLDPTHVISTSSGFSGINSAVVLCRA